MVFRLYKSIHRMLLEFKLSIALNYEEGPLTCEKVNKSIELRFHQWNFHNRSDFMQTTIDPPREACEILAAITCQLPVSATHIHTCVRSCPTQLHHSLRDLATSLKYRDALASVITASQPDLMQLLPHFFPMT